MTGRPLYLHTFVVRLGPGAALDTAPRNGQSVAYVERGALHDGGAPARIGANAAGILSANDSLQAGRDGARVIRWDVSPRSRLDEIAPGCAHLRTDPFALPENPQHSWLIRCDRVDFPPAGTALLHTHQGPGTRVLLSGTFRVETGGKTHDIGPLEAWFEAGPEPVFAQASMTEPTSFVRVMVLPASLLGISSIVYVNEEDRAKPKSQSYQGFVDQVVVFE